MLLNHADRCGPLRAPWSSGDARTLPRSSLVLTIPAVGGGPSGPSIEGPFCCAVHLCRALGDQKIEKKRINKEKKKEK